jgi:hypothetical protein
VFWVRGLDYHYFGSASSLLFVFSVVSRTACIALEILLSRLVQRFTAWDDVEMLLLRSWDSKYDRVLRDMVTVGSSPNPSHTSLNKPPASSVLSVSRSVPAVDAIQRPELLIGRSAALSVCAVIGQPLSQPRLIPHFLRNSLTFCSSAGNSTTFHPRQLHHPPSKWSRQRSPAIRTPPAFRPISQLLTCARIASRLALVMKSGKGKIQRCN